MLSYALLAPNPHNLQPWLADLHTPGQITLSLDAQRLLPATDPFGRQILMGAGAFLELLSLAAAERGHRVELALFPDGLPGPRLDDRPFARLRLLRVGSAEIDQHRDGISLTSPLLMGLAKTACLTAAASRRPTPAPPKA